MLNVRKIPLNSHSLKCFNGSFIRSFTQFSPRRNVLLSMCVYECLLIYVSCGSFKENIFISWVFALISLSKYKLDGCVLVCVFCVLQFHWKRVRKNHHLFASILLLCDDNREYIAFNGESRWKMDIRWTLLFITRHSLALLYSVLYSQSRTLAFCLCCEL